MTTVKKINKTYHILVYSNLTTNVSGQSYSCTALFDFGLLPRSRWKVKLYGGFGSAGYTSNQLPQIHVELGQKYVDYGRNPSNAFPANIKFTTLYVGNMISYTNYAGNCSFNIPAGDNGYFYLDETPTGNIFNISVLNLANLANWTPGMNNALFGFAFEQLDDPIYRTVKNVYNVVFNSEYGLNNSTTDNSLGTKNYYFDWSLLPQGEYEVSTNMYTSTDTSTNYSSYTIFCDFGQGDKTVFIPSSITNSEVPSTNFLSVVFVEQSGSAGPLVCYSDYSPPVFLTSRPSNNNVNLYINSIYTGQYYYSRALGINMNYTINFTFRWLGQK